MGEIDGMIRLLLDSSNQVRMRDIEFAEAIGREAAQMKRVGMRGCVVEDLVIKVGSLSKLAGAVKFHATLK
jgi:hypothetical protein